MRARDGSRIHGQGWSWHEGLVLKLGEGKQSWTLGIAVPPGFRDGWVLLLILFVLGVVG